MEELSPLEVYKWTDLVLSATRESLQKEGFHEILPTVISKRLEPGARHSIAVLGARRIPTISVDESKQPNAVVTVKGKEAYYIAVSNVVEKQMAMEFLEKAYCLAPCLRLLMEGEDISGRHLYTFFQVEIEIRDATMEMVFDAAESLLSSIGTLTLSRLKSAGLTNNRESKRNLAALTRVPFKRLRFEDALRSLGSPSDRITDLTSAEEAKLADGMDRPFWIHDYPQGVRDSLYKRNPSGKYDTYDLILPFGFGELTTGGVRPESKAEILRQSNLLGKEVSTDYAAWKERTGIQSAGYGIGLERLVRFCSGVQSILSVRQYHDDGPNVGIGRPQDRGSPYKKKEEEPVNV